MRNLRPATDCRVLFDGPVWLHYGQLYVASEPELQDSVSANWGLSNGLCGSALPGFLFLTTATHTGTVPVRVELWTDNPITDKAWEDVVETSFQASSDHVSLVQWAYEATWALALPRQLLAVRYCACGMDEAGMAEVKGAQPPDRYLLQFWPSTATELDRVVREGSRFANVRRAQPTGPGWGPAVIGRDHSRLER